MLLEGYLSVLECLIEVMLGDCSVELFSEKRALGLRCFEAGLSSFDTVV